MLIVCVNSVFSFADVCLLFLVRFNNVRTVISYWLRRVSLKFGCGPLWTWVGRGSPHIPHEEEHFRRRHIGTCSMADILKLTHKGAAHSDATCSPLLLWLINFLHHWEQLVAVTGAASRFDGNDERFRRQFVIISSCLFHRSKYSNEPHDQAEPSAE